LLGEGGEQRADRKVPSLWGPPRPVPTPYAAAAGI
jgi:hypothetical protein